MSSGIPIWPCEPEITARVNRLKENMAEAALDALVITSQHNFEYYTGFRSLFWLSDTRPFLAIVSRDKPGISIIVNRGEYGEIYSHLHVVPYDGFTDAALNATARFLSELPKGSAVGLDYGPDMNGRGSVALINFLQGAPQHFRLTDAADLIWRQRLIKSDHEFQAKRTACNIATDAFFDGLTDLKLGISEYEFGQLLKMRMIGLGADSVDWLPVRFGQGGMNYAAPNSDRPLQVDDFIWVDMGARRGDQISDLNRIAKVGRPTPEQEDIYDFVRDVTLCLAEGICPGMTGHDAFALFEKLWSARDFSRNGRLAIAGRVGHGSGVALTEPPSLMAGSTEVILEDMVLHVEPKLEIADGVFQLEEVFRVTPTGPEFLSTISPAKLPTVEL
ncbi:M24 family metallopeptidase [Sinorhizobium meliloti]|uniref:M24 family metallopeptidase n=1 Tax=Rhizobium meliloti TaxID=382 RepID=UPI001295B259|nr:Xaa-Pro peptidase family protein [Sinorhizobium meliloti]MQW24338.1 M24 family metallopeptidase [Sinorhizobium meliloti]